MFPLFQNAITQVPDCQSVHVASIWMNYCYLILQLPNPLQSSSREGASFPLMSVLARWLSLLHLFAASPFSSSPPPSSSWTSPWSCRRWRTRCRRAPGLCSPSVRGCWRGTRGCRSWSRRCCRRLFEACRVPALNPCFLGVMFRNRHSPAAQSEDVSVYGEVWLAFNKQHCQHAATRAGPHPLYGIKRSGVQLNRSTVLFRKKRLFLRKKVNLKGWKCFPVSAL